jgi:hypothetical protein
MCPWRRVNIGSLLWQEQWGQLGQSDRHYKPLWTRVLFYFYLTRRRIKGLMAGAKRTTFNGTLESTGCTMFGQKKDFKFFSFNELTYQEPFDLPHYCIEKYPRFNDMSSNIGVLESFNCKFDSWSWPKESWSPEYLPGQVSISVLGLRSHVNICLRFWPDVSPVNKTLCTGCNNWKPKK